MADRLRAPLDLVTGAEPGVDGAEFARRAHFSRAFARAKRRGSEPLFRADGAFRAQRGPFHPPAGLLVP